MQLNLQDPLTFVLLVAITGVVLVGFYFAIREVIADAILLADKKRDAQKDQQRKRP